MKVNNEGKLNTGYNPRADFLVSEVDNAGKSLTDENGIVKSEIMYFSKEDLLCLISRASNIKRRRYGYDVFYKNKNYFIRFENHTTSVRLSAADYVNKYYID